jgi:hypothetical protein
MSENIHEYDNIPSPETFSQNLWAYSVRLSHLLAKIVLLSIGCSYTITADQILMNMLMPESNSDSK